MCEMFQLLDYNIDSCSSGRLAGNYYFDQGVNPDSVSDAYFDYEDDMRWEHLVYESTLEILEAFEDEDWNLLLQKLPEKTPRWQMRLIDCLNFADINEKSTAYAGYTLLQMLKTNDAALFSSAIASLWDYPQENITYDEELYEKAEAMLKMKTTPNKWFLEQFLATKP